MDRCGRSTIGKKSSAVLKTHRDNRTWLVSQPDHGRVAGYLAAHWGNDQFAAPGHFADTHDPEQLCAETVLAIAEHDNGWWEWEAIPELGGLDDLPLDLAEVLKNQQEGMDRWQRGIPRFGEETSLCQPADQLSCLLALRC